MRNEAQASRPHRNSAVLKRYPSGRGCELGNRLVRAGRKPPAKVALGGGRLMTQLQYSTGSFRASRAQTQTSPQQRIFGIAFAVTMEAVIVYTLMVALGYAPAPPAIPGDLIVVNVAPASKDDVTPPPPTQTFDPPPLVID